MVLYKAVLPLTLPHNMHSITHAGMTHADYMRRAIGLAKRAGQRGEVPIAALVLLQGKVIASASNRRESQQDATSHAEVLAIRRACKQVGDWRLNHATLYVTMEPCLMCFGAAIQARVATIVYGCRNPKNPEYLRQIYQQWPGAPKMLGDVEASAAVEILSRFFKKLR